MHFLLKMKTLISINPTSDDTSEEEVEANTSMQIG
jgi:hypothetical protein